MAAFEYDITTHSSEKLRQVVYLCNAQGTCDLGGIEQQQIEAFRSLLNERGAAGWEAVQVIGGRDGIAVIWKRAIP